MSSYYFSSVKIETPPLTGCTHKNKQHAGLVFAKTKRIFKSAPIFGIRQELIKIYRDPKRWKTVKSFSD